MSYATSSSDPVIKMRVTLEAATWQQVTLAFSVQSSDRYPFVMKFGRKPAILKLSEQLRQNRTFNSDALLSTVSSVLKV